MDVELDQDIRIFCWPKYLSFFLFKIPIVMQASMSYRPGVLWAFQAKGPKMMERWSRIKLGLQLCPKVLPVILQNFLLFLRYSLTLFCIPKSN